MNLIPYETEFGFRSTKFDFRSTKFDSRSTKFGSLNIKFNSISIRTSYSLFWKFSKEIGASEAIKNHELKYISVNEYQIKGNKIEKHTWKCTF